MILNSINNKSIDISLWILRNVNKIRLWIKILLIVFISGTYYLFVLNLVNFVQGGRQTDALYKNVLENKNFVVFDKYLKSIAPESLYLAGSGAVPGYADKFYDFYAIVQNKNPNYVVDSLEYSFKYNDDFKTQIQKDRLNISSDKYLFLRGVEAGDDAIKNSNFELESIDWKLVDKNTKYSKVYIDTQVPRLCSFQKSELEINGLKIVRNVNSKTQREVNVLVFNVKNNSLYNYNSIDNKILFYDRSNNVVGIFEKELYQLKSGEEKEVTFNISPNVKDVANVLVVPEIDLCSDSSFMKKELINKGI